MQLHRAQATFGKLNHQSLELRRGLNIIHAPNETGKSTWCAFLLAMFYGINSRERDKAGYIAEKNRYQPWNGSAMSGRLELSGEQQEITLTRTTRRATAPMGEFQAVYTGTATPVPNLSAANCGEMLLGVSREVFERSCFIRQSGLSITQDAELERRIAALITTGDEETSYTEACDALKKQLNRRQHNRTGQIPALEAELSDLRRQTEDARRLQEQLLQLRTQADALGRRKQALEAELEQHRKWEQALQQKQLNLAQSAAERAEEQADALERQLHAAGIPDADTIIRLQNTIVNLGTLRTTVNAAETAQRRAQEELREAEANLAASPYAGQTEEQVRNAALNLPPRPKYNVFLMIAAGILAGAGAYFLLPEPNPIYAAGIGVAGVLAAAFIEWLFVRRRLADWESQIAKLRQLQEAEADAYHSLLEQQQSAQANAASKTDTLSALRTSYNTNERAVLAHVRRFAPAAAQLAVADAALKQAAERRAKWTDAVSIAQRARMRYEVLAQQGSPTAEPVEDVPQPERSREEAAGELSAVTAQLAASTSAADRLAGQLHMIGDPAVLTAAARQKEDQLARLKGEYEAIRLAMDTLEAANTTLQNRFSPELGQRATEIFHRLTDNRYQSVTMDRSFHLSARPEDDSIDRSIQLLSSGAADQLYLATRLAICDLVLPEEQNAPMILDDALANFDDARCAAALEYLKELSGKRQVILFSCHSREADYFAGDEQVFVQRLTNAV